MILSIDLPATLEEALEAEAQRGGVSVSEHATFLLQLMTAVSRTGQKTPFRNVVQAYLRQNSLDSDRLAEVFETLMAFCLSESRVLADCSGAEFSDPNEVIGNEDVLALLRGWRSPTANRRIDDDVETVTVELPALDQDGQKMRRTDRPSIRGKYAHITLSTDDLMLEKQREIDHEDRGR